MNSDYTDYSLSNEFLSKIYDLFEASYLYKPEDITKKVVKDSRFFWSKKVIDYNKKKEESYEKILLFVQKLRTIPPSFDTLFDFASFVKSVEKVFFYKNDLTSKICCDSSLNEKTSRKLIFTLNDVVIVLKMDRLNISDEYIDILITRKFGKNMETKYSIKNQQMKYNDCNDLMLVNVLNNILQNCLADFVQTIADEIYYTRILTLDRLGTFYSLDNQSIKGCELSEERSD